MLSVFNRLKALGYETPAALKDAILLPEEADPEGDIFRTRNVEISGDDTEGL